MTDHPVAAHPPKAAEAEIVEAFLYAVMRDKNFDRVSTLVADNLVYENVGYSTMHGGQRIVKTFRTMAARVPGLNWDVKFHRIVSEGSTVLTERTDTIIVGPFRAHFWVCGAFEVHDGKVLLWRDYFDLVDVLRGCVRGLVAIAIPSLQRQP